MTRATSHRQVLLLHPDEEFQRLVRSSVPEGFGCWTLTSWERLRETARDAPPSTLAIVDPYLGSDSPDRPASEARSFLDDFSWLPVVAVLAPGPTGPADVRTLRQWGVAEVILRGMEDTPDGIPRAIRFAQGAILRGVMQEILPPSVTGRRRRLLFGAAEAVATGGHAPDLAAVLGVTETTVMRRCESLRLPPPRRLLAWVRVLLAARLLETPDRTSQSVAYACGYATEAGLRRVLKDFLGMGVTELRGRGALETAAGTFLKELRELRERG